jgi:hypothetical protein
MCCCSRLKFISWAKELFFIQLFFYRSLSHVCMWTYVRYMEKFYFRGFVHHRKKQKKLVVDTHREWERERRHKWEMLTRSTIKISMCIHSCATLSEDINMFSMDGDIYVWTHNIFFLYRSSGRWVNVFLVHQCIRCKRTVVECGRKIYW